MDYTHWIAHSFPSGEWKVESLQLGDILMLYIDAHAYYEDEQGHYSKVVSIVAEQFTTNFYIVYWLFLVICFTGTTKTINRANR